MLDHKGQISIPVTTERGTVLVSTVFSQSLTYNVMYFIDNHNHATALSAQFQLIIVLIHMVRKPSTKPTVLAK